LWRLLAMLSLLLGVGLGALFGLHMVLQPLLYLLPLPPLVVLLLLLLLSLHTATAATPVEFSGMIPTSMPRIDT
jgi:hypothetical protein